MLPFILQGYASNSEDSESCNERMTTNSSANSDNHDYDIKKTVPKTFNAADNSFKYDYEPETGTLVLESVHLSSVASEVTQDSSIASSWSNTKIFIVKNIIISSKIVKIIVDILHSCQDAIEVLIFDHGYFLTDFTLDLSLNLKELRTVKIIHCSLNGMILKNILNIFPKSLQTLELTGLYRRSKNYNYLYIGNYLKLDFSYLDTYERFPSLKRISIKENEVKGFSWYLFEDLEEIDANNFALGSHTISHEEMFNRLSNLKNLKVIKSKFYAYFTKWLQYFEEKNIILDCKEPLHIEKHHLQKISLILSTCTRISFFMYVFDESNINFDTVVQDKECRQLSTVKFGHIKNINHIYLMNSFLRRFQSINKMEIFFYNTKVTEEDINLAFSNVEPYVNIEEISFTWGLMDTISTVIQFIVQVLKRLPSLKSISFESFFPEDNEMIFARLTEENMSFPMLQKINIAPFLTCNNFNPFFWPLQNASVKELNIESYYSVCTESELLENFTNNTLEKLSIGGEFIDCEPFIKRIFEKITNLKKLTIERKHRAISLFENNPTIQKFAFLRTNPKAKCCEYIFKVLKTFKELQCVYLKFDDESRFEEIGKIFNKYFKDTSVELIFFRKISFPQNV